MSYTYNKVKRRSIDRKPSRSRSRSTKREPPAKPGSKHP
jgi:hypothetical protein